MFIFRKKLDNNWKEKATERNLEIKKLKKRVKELSKNRDKWKNEAEKFLNLFRKEKKKLHNK